MEPFELVVVGAGISGLSLAWKAAREGRRVLVLEREERLGGCVRSEKTAEGFWFELGAHTAYNSYGALLDIIAATGLTPELRARGEARSRFGLLREGRYRWLTPPKTLLQLNWLEAAVHAPFGAFRSKRGRTLAEHCSGLLGKRNYRRVLGPFLSAVPSQPAGDFPAEGPGSLFKKRARREEFLRSFGVEGGLQRICEAIAGTPGIAIERGAAVRAVSKYKDGFRIELSSGRVLEAKLAAVAAPLEVAREVVREGFPALAAALGAIASVQVESLGAVLPREKAWMPACAFLVPVEDSFFSCVTRDPFPDEKFRAFAFHFRPGLTREERLARACAVLRVEARDFVHLAEQRVSLPSPGREHREKLAAVVAALAKDKLALTGNYFDGLALEDCVLRSNAEWQRISSPT